MPVKFAGRFFRLPEAFVPIIVPIYCLAKPPGKPADMNEPFVLPAGSTVMDLAEAVHRQLAKKLKFARAWGTGVHDGQNVHRSSVLSDKDIIELHFL